MKRDLDLIRAILLQVEEEPREGFPIFLEIPNYDPDTLSNHVRLLAEGGYLESTPWDGEELPTRLTWAGHELLEALRPEKTFEKMKRVFKEQGIPMLIPASIKIIERLATMLP